MSKRKRKRNKKKTGFQVMHEKAKGNSKDSKPEPKTSSIIHYNWKKDCHTAKYVNVADSKVFCCGFNDLTVRARREIEKLDLFIGMVSSFKKFETSPHGSNKFVSQFMRMLEPDCWSNLIIVDVRDYGIDKKLAETTIEAFRNKWSIGFGCLAGHGRTGWLLGRLIREFEKLEGMELKKAIRERLCHEAIEGSEQFIDLGLTPEIYQSAMAWQGHNFNIDYADYEPKPEIKSYKSLFEQSEEEERKSAKSVIEEERAKDLKKLLEKNKIECTNSKYQVTVCKTCNGSGFKDGYTCHECDGSGISLSKGIV